MSSGVNSVTHTKSSHLCEHTQHLSMYSKSCTLSYSLTVAYTDTHTTITNTWKHTETHTASQLSTHKLQPRPVCVHKTVQTCQEHKHFYPACQWPCFANLIRLHTNLFVNVLHQHTHKTTKSVHSRLTHQVQNAFSDVLTPCSAAQKHYKCHKSLTVCGPLIAA